jgi:propionyl-CoA carboxylase alpha chain
MLRAIDDYKIVGVETTLDFCKFVLKHNAFISGKFDTGFINNFFAPELLKSNTPEFIEIAALASSIIFKNKTQSINELPEQSFKKSSWKHKRLN